jgi:hypothetical protein
MRLWRYSEIQPIIIGYILGSNIGTELTNPKVTMTSKHVLSKSPFTIICVLHQRLTHAVEKTLLNKQRNNTTYAHKPIFFA